jgi:hypothetical protein
VKNNSIFVVSSYLREVLVVGGVVKKTGCCYSVALDKAGCGRWGDAASVMSEPPVT